MTGLRSPLRFRARLLATSLRAGRPRGGATLMTTPKAITTCTWLGARFVLTGSWRRVSRKLRLFLISGSPTQVRRKTCDAPGRMSVCGGKTRKSFETAPLRDLPLRSTVRLFSTASTGKGAADVLRTTTEDRLLEPADFNSM